jgi:hypothetical protein
VKIKQLRKPFVSLCAPLQCKDVDGDGHRRRRRKAALRMERAYVSLASALKCHTLLRRDPRNSDSRSKMQNPKFSNSFRKIDHGPGGQRYLLLYRFFRSRVLYTSISGRYNRDPIWSITMTSNLILRLKAIIMPNCHQSEHAYDIGDRYREEFESWETLEAALFLKTGGETGEARVFQNIHILRWSKR